MIRVRDTGIGIAKENITEAFTLFGQVNTARSVESLRVLGSACCCRARWHDCMAVI